MDHTNLYYMVHNVLVQLPSLLTILCCIVFAIVRWKRHPKVSLTVATSLSLLFMHSLFFAFVFAFVTDWLVKPGDYLAMQRVTTVISFIYNSSLAIALAVLLAGVFMQRKAPARTSA